MKFVPEGGTEIELADLIINLEDVILAIQLKERNEKDRTQDKNVEEKWLKKKCKKAKEQIKDTILFINNEKVSFANARGKETKKRFFLSKPQKQETLVHQYLYEQYGDDVLAEDNFYYELFIFII